MLTTPNMGWPVAQGTDPAKQYPAAVDQPFKAALDATIQILRGGSLIRLRLGTDTAGLPTGSSDLPMAAILSSAGTDLVGTGGYIRVDTAGLYEVGASVSFTTVPANSEVDAIISKKTSGGTLLDEFLIGGHQSTAAVPYTTFSGTALGNLLAGERLYLTAFNTVAGAVALAKSQMWARRVG